jgi:dihydroorotate dehydrogenase electron transfer subunit
MPHDIVTPVTRNADLGHDNYLIEFRAPEMLDGMRPAQFFMIGIPGAEMLLRRPFSVCGLPGTFDDAPPDTAQVLYKVIGKGTGLLAALSAGAPLTVLGPLGNGFGLPAPGDTTTRTIFVAGGIGSAPFPAQAAVLAKNGNARPLMFYGARGAGDLPLRDWFAEHCELVESTDDGSLGHHGLVTEPLAEHLAAEEHSERIVIQACGPEPMLKAVRRLALERGVRCELSLEAHMACGFGVCLGCVVPTHGEGGADTGYERICVDGPVMPAEHLAW